jgi:hypothetical protein
MRMRIAAGLLLVSTAAMAAPGSSVGYEDGGSYYTYQSVVQQYNASGELFRIDGVCQAACTMFLAIRNVCIGPNARLMFRAASENRRRHEGHTRLALAHYNASLRSYLIEQRVMDQWEKYHTVYGGDLVSRFGYRKCPP